MSKEDWKNKTGISFITRPDEDILEAAIKCNGKTLNSINSSDLDEVLVTLSNYYLFLQSRLGEAQAKINFLNQKIDSEIGKSTAKMSGGHFSERKALAIATNDGLSNMSKELIEEQAKHDILVPISRGIYSKMDIVKRIYERKSREART